MCTRDLEGGARSCGGFFKNQHHGLQPHQFSGLRSGWVFFQRDGALNESDQF